MYDRFRVSRAEQKRRAKLYRNAQRAGVLEFVPGIITAFATHNRRLGAVARLRAVTPRNSRHAN